MSVLLTVLLVALIALFGLKAWNTYAEHNSIGQAPLEPHTMTIDGDGKVTGKPTLAQIDIGVYSEGTDVPSVQNDNSQKVNAMTAAMQDLGIAEADLQTSNYNISPKYDYKNGQQNVVGYSVSQNVSVKVRDLTKVGAALAKAGQLGANQVNGVSFTIDDPSQLQQQAREKALADARKKADELAGALGVQIIRVTTFSETSANPQPIPYAFRSDTGLGASAAPIAPAIQTGSLDVTSHVSVTFEIR